MKSILLRLPSTEVVLDVSLSAFFQVAGVKVVKLYTDIPCESVETSSFEVLLNLVSSDVAKLIPEWITLDTSATEMSEIVAEALSLMLESHAITPIDFKDLKLVLDSLEKTDNSALQAIIIYNERNSCNGFDIDNVYEPLRNAISSLSDSLIGMDVPLWGTLELPHTRYALLYISYALDVYCGKFCQDRYVEMSSIKRGCMLASKDSTELSDMFSILHANVLEDLVEDISHAFEVYSELVDEDITGDVALRMGNLLFKKKEYVSAIKYLTRATATYPLHDTAWYLLGVCYADGAADTEKAKNAFNNVETILGNRSELRKLSMTQVKRLFDACERMTSYEGATCNLRKALNYAMDALNACHSGSTKYFKELGMDHLIDPMKVQSPSDTSALQRAQKACVELSMSLGLEYKAKECLALTEPSA